ncbi:MAG: low-specificity L-threonine aldolase [candidate division KSB1 bacterium]|nr:low-specificity L-threonine aldolase [candidate division KSB1 bacterium]MDZ7334519.1 low-specificity L-threonine aldolase [candidate division KSB1 bacterium]MDZ7356966.1 low-specificity L-threonine aldolase [candidate division KSB1 bacterium]MDZ7400972.1 low-specificity L-threonine aldolase [candidate division KSB1 bacterium]
MNKIVDLRSDTVTRPSPEMRRAMAEAEVGDDVFGDDPTVNLLQTKVAELLGKEAALFTPSGTMANTIAILAHTQPGDEVIVERESHTFNYEVAGAAVIGGVQINTILGERGIITADQIAREIREPNVHVPPTRLICLENTHNRGGGSIYPIDKIQAIHALAQQHGLKMHLDGARLFNACVATGLHPKDYAKYFDSVMFCFSKGLGAPVGSILAGSKPFIQRAHRIRKMLGGGMRQVGILAAAALYALEHNVQRLAEDHRHAKMLATALAQIKGFRLDPDQVETNIVIFDVAHSGRSVAEVLNRLKSKGILMVPFGPSLVRAVTHLDVSREDIDFTIQTLHELFD